MTNIVNIGACLSLPLGLSFCLLIEPLAHIIGG